MKTISLLLLFFLFLSCQYNPAPSPEEDKKAVKQTLTAMWEAIEKEDMTSYSEYIHPDYTQFGESDSILRMGKKTEIDAISSWLDNASDIHTEMIEPNITVKGNVAWIAYNWADSGFSNGVAFTSGGKSTRIFIKEEGKWLCIHGHFTLLP